MRFKGKFCYGEQSMPAKTNVKITAAEITSIVRGTLHGSGAIKATVLAPLEDATAGALTLIRERSALQIRRILATTKAAVILCPTAPEGTEIPADKALIVVEKPFESLLLCMPHFFEPHPPLQGISPLASIDPSAKIGPNVAIGAFAVIGPLVELAEHAVIHPHVVLYPGVKIGARSVIHSNVSIREDCQIGSDAVIQNGSVVGADGFGYLPDPVRGLVAVPQLGNVLLADRVEVGANSAIDRGTLGATRIGLGTKIDNLVQVGHNTKIGMHSILCGQVGIAGSCEIGNQVVLGGQVGVGDHLAIVDGVRVAAKSGVTGSLSQKGDYMGHPILPAQLARRVFALLPQLPELIKRLKRGG
jgi:UDP-3-O-[3-hydroxymyristoyl] glucosamine N-acyltransferase